ncbi:hypothetical protein ACPPVO_20700 [Dactylosporangium sp. McL0621]|uniref:hypothetical protein n=1 Tax=Dactylosporangium sp. McL0621 TaxID=3415678 RepID=UPI003CE7D0F5
MTSDGEGSSRLRIGSWLPEPTVRPPHGTATAPPAPPGETGAGDDDGDAPAPPPSHRRTTGGGRRRLLAAAGGLALCAAIAATVTTCAGSPGGGIASPDAAVAPSHAPAVVESPAESGEAHLDRYASLTPSRTPSRAAFPPIGLEAETASAELAGPAEIVAYPGASGGRIVQNLGRQGPGAKRNGTLTFPDVTVPADGAYTLTLYLVNSGPDAAGTVVITVAGGSVSVTATGGTDCCVRTVATINLAKGPNSLTFGNSDGRAPSLDRIVVSAP